MMPPMMPPGGPMMMRPPGGHMMPPPGAPALPHDAPPPMPDMEPDSKKARTGEFVLQAEEEFLARYRSPPCAGQGGAVAAVCPVGRNIGLLVPGRLP